MASSSSESLVLAVAHATTFLTQPLHASYSPNALLKLQMILEANLIAHCAPSWNPREPVKGSGRRCLSLSPDCLPPRPIWSACTAANVQWFDWIASFGNTELNLFIDPGCVAVRIDGQIQNIWADDAYLDHRSSKAAQPAVSHKFGGGKTFAQRVLESEGDEDDEIFALLNDQIATPTWINPVVPPFVPSNRSASPLSSVSEHSRCSSRSSNSSSSAFSFSSGDSASSRTSASGASKPSSENKQSRRERARAARVFVDTSKIDVTPYDGGKTTVLTGGVMLGGSAKGPKPKKVAAPSATSNSNSWRSVRA